MKKSKLKIALVTSFIASMALAACGSKVTKSDKDLVNFKPYDGETDLSISIDEIYKDYMKSSSGISKYYDQVLEVLIRNAFQKDKTGTGSFFGGSDVKLKKNYNKILSEAKDSVKGQKDTAKENAKSNGTNYSTEWKAILAEKGVKDEEELLQYFIYKLEKEQIEDWYFDNHEEEIKKEYLGVDSTGAATAQKVSSRFPYHVRHILIKVEDGASDFVRGTVSADQAKALSKTVELLAQGTLSFGEVAAMKSEDSSNSSYGDVGIMTNAISSGKLGMVNEFQLGIYAYDALNLNTPEDDAHINQVLEEGLGLDRKINVKNPAFNPANPESESNPRYKEQTVRNYFQSAVRHINEIPYSVFVELGDVADQENNESTGLPVEDGKAAIYPRNLLWNRYLNNHGIFVITNSARPANAAITGSENDTIDVNSGSYLETETLTLKDGSTKSLRYVDGTGEGQKSPLVGFNRVTSAGALITEDDHDNENKRVLADEQGNVIIGVRSEFGIHLMIVQKSIYEFSAGGDTTKVPSLEEYYTTAVPGSKDGKYPTYKVDGVDHDKETYVNFINTVKTTDYRTRADDVRSKIKGFDSTYDYRLYEDLIANSNVDMSNESTKEVIELINDYIDLQRTKNEDAQEEGMKEVWQTYAELLELQDFYRHELNRIVPEGCKIAFTKSTLSAAEKAAYEEGGRCYVK